MQTNEQKNNLTFLRIFSALLVLYSHSFVFLGLQEPTMLGYHSLGSVGVWIFFSISGYLVAQSWERDPHAIRFIWRRILRISPGLMTCIILSVFILGPVLTNLSLFEYYKNPATYGYFHNIFLHITFYLPGVFESNRLPNVVNGSLWSLPAEFAMYFLLMLIGLLGRYKLAANMVLILFLLLNVFWIPGARDMVVVYRTDLRQIVICGAFFWAGVTYQHYNVQRWFNHTNSLLAMVVLMALTRWPEAFRLGIIFILPFLVLSFGLIQGGPLARLKDYDYSFGIYIYAFPVQQTLVYFWPTMNIWVHVAVATAITVCLAALSWHWIEKFFLSFKPKAKKRESV